MAQYNCQVLLARLFLVAGELHGCMEFEERVVIQCGNCTVQHVSEEDKSVMKVQANVFSEPQSRSWLESVSAY